MHDGNNYGEGETSEGCSGWQGWLLQVRSDSDGRRSSRIWWRCRLLPRFFLSRQHSRYCENPCSVGFATVAACHLLSPACRRIWSVRRYSIEMLHPLVDEILPRGERLEIPKDTTGSTRLLVALPFVDIAIVYQAQGMERAVVIDIDITVRPTRQSSPTVPSTQQAVPCRGEGDYSHSRPTRVGWRLCTRSGRKPPPRQHPPRMNCTAGGQC
jgi:hypothetical protein